MNSSLPSVGPGALKNREDLTLLGTPKVGRLLALPYESRAPATDAFRSLRSLPAGNDYARTRHPLLQAPRHRLLKGSGRRRHVSSRLRIPGRGNAQ